MGKLKEFYAQKKDKAFEMYIDKKPLPIVYFTIVAVIFAAAFIGRFNFLAIIMTFLGAVTGIIIFVRIFKDGKLNFWYWGSYVILLFGTFLFFLVWGAEDFGIRLGYNGAIAFLSLVVPILMFFIPSLLKNKVHLQYITACIGAILLIGASLIYLFTMSLRVKPNVLSLQEGHDTYLSELAQNERIGADAPNVLVILMDDMAYSDISSFSYLGRENATIKTPNIDSIGDDGAVMENFYASSPVCSPSRFSMLTGRYSSRGYLDNVVFPSVTTMDPYCITRYFNPFEFQKNVDGILGDEITVAEIMQAIGYRTGLIGKWNLGDYGQYLPTNQGFDYFFGSHYVNDMTPYNIVREEKGQFEEVYSHNDLLDQSLSTPRFTQELKTFITDSLENEGKFFAQYWTPWPHYPIFSGQENDKSDDNYIDCIEEFDSYLGEVLNLLKEKGVYDDTLIIFTSDNGPGREGVTGALRGRKNTTFDGGQKVPFMACYPNGGIGKGEYLQGQNTNVVGSTAMNMDMFTTILDYCGIRSLPSDRIIDGISLKNSLNGTVANDAFLHDKLFHLKKGKCQGVQMPMRATITFKDKDGNVIDDNYESTFDFKYYDRVATENSAFIDQVYKNYLFNLDTDPAEGYNISMVYPDIAKRLNEELIEFRKQMQENRRGKI